MCVCVHASWLKGVMTMEVGYCKKAHNSQMDILTGSRFSEKVGHEQKDSWLTVQANWQKWDVAAGVVIIECLPHFSHKQAVLTHVEYVLLSRSVLHVT